MAIIKPTSTGSNFLQKTNTDADRIVLRGNVNYDVQLGAVGPIFTLPFRYVPGTNSLQVFVDGIKAQVSQSPASATEYSEDSDNQITFGLALAPTAIVEFYANQYIAPVYNHTLVNRTTNYVVQETDLYGNVTITNRYATSDIVVTLPLVTINAKLTLLNESDNFYLRANANIIDKFKYTYKESTLGGHIGLLRLGHSCTLLGITHSTGNFWRVLNINGKVYYDY